MCIKEYIGDDVTEIQLSVRKAIQGEYAAQLSHQICNGKHASSPTIKITLSSILALQLHSEPSYLLLWASLRGSCHPFCSTIPLSRLPACMLFCFTAFCLLFCLLAVLSSFHPSILLNCSEFKQWLKSSIHHCTARINLHFSGCCQQLRVSLARFMAQKEGNERKKTLIKWVRLQEKYNSP